jgi:hypothetical protein
MSIWSALGLVEDRRGAGRYLGGCPFGRSTVAIGPGGSARGRARLAARDLTLRGKLGLGRCSERDRHFDSSFVAINDGDCSVGELSGDGCRG